ncbi:hypothetical protein QBC44DRAFT_123425 [Cladorrhinum sp. PSN332]|nr:hypothetical protein QBC44DRAFT_123425 [Cladorrhinum sp. PSN332]
MAQTRGQLAAQNKAQASVPKERGSRHSGARAHPRRARLHGHRKQTVTERAESPHSHPPSVVPYQKDLPTSLGHRGQRRSRAVADLLEPLDEPPRKRRQPSHHIEETFGQEAVQDDADSSAGPIDFWVRENKWPPGYSEQSLMEQLLARKRSSSALGRKRSEAGSMGHSSVTPSDQKPREEKSAPYRDPRYKTLLANMGSFMDKSDLGITDASKKLCHTLLESKQTVPQDSLFRDDIFESTCRKVEDKNEARVIRDIAPLIVPSAEILATYGATKLNCLIESVNEGWNNSIPLTGTRPQPDYSVGFKREAFTEEQLSKLSPFIGNWLSGDLSFFMATYLMYFPFLTCEVKCGAAALNTADRQNAHSMTLAARAIVELFRLMKRESELNRELLAFSISHDHCSVRIYGCYPVIDGKDTKYYRHPIHKFDFTTLDGKEKCTAYRFTKNVYDVWMPKHFERICSAIDQLPSNLDFDVPSLPETGLSQGLESHHLSQPDDDKASMSKNMMASQASLTSTDLLQTRRSRGQGRQRGRGKQTVWNSLTS